MDQTPKRLGGMHTDNSYVDQPEGTTRFVLNGVEETREGDSNFIATEEAFEDISTISFPSGYSLIDEVYIGKRSKVVFLVKDDETLSEIGIIERETYTTLVNSPDLKFSLNRPIDAVYRLRRGCERTIYWADPKLRYLNIDDLDSFKDSLGNWDMDKFRLFKTYSKIPTFDSVEVTEEGNLLPGSYNLTIQYLDSDLNPTEWITTSQTIIIYNDNLDTRYKDIRGSTNLKTPYQDFGRTNKAIKVTFGNMDTDYPFYRVGIIEANEGTGQISRVAVSQERPIDIPTFTYTGTAAGTIPVEEVSAFTTVIEEAQHLEQLENRLIPANVKGKDIDYCQLQKYASRIKADAVTKSSVLNNMGEGSPKLPTVYFDGTGYMPGEIYSFAINYIFKDGTTSPSYHIPGKAASTVDTTFTQNSYPMSIDNELEDTFYTEGAQCSSYNYWGKDSEGNDLLGEKVRHHRFPTREEVGLDFITETETTVGTEKVILMNFVVTGTIDAGYTEDEIEFGVNYTVSGGPRTYSGVSFSVADYTPGDTITVETVVTNSNLNIDIINQFENLVQMGYPTSPTPLGLTYTYTPTSTTRPRVRKDRSSEMMGIRFSGIDIPSKEELGEEVIGYYITRNERTDDNKTVLDTAVLVPLLDEDYYTGFGHMWPDLSDQTKINRDVVGFISPEISFFKKDFKNIDQVIKVGELTKFQQSASNVLIQDVMAGTSFDPEVHKRRENDTDGFDLHFLSRDTRTAYDPVSPIEVITDTHNIKEVFYLDALESKEIIDSENVGREVFNVSADNRMGFIQFESKIDLDNFSFSKKPYVIFKRNLSNPYQNYRLDPYYKEHSNPVFFTFDGSGNITGGDEVDVFNGDVVITPMRHTTSSYYDIRLANRATKSGLFNFIVGVVAIIAGAVGAIFTAGASLGLVAVGVSAIGFGVTQIATGLKKETLRRVWGETYADGLKDTLDDGDTSDTLEYDNPDDEIQWFSDTTSNLWFESTVNMGLRQGADQKITDFLNGPVEEPAKVVSNFSLVSETQNEVDAYMLSKITLLDSENGDGRLYQGFANAEIYEINPDFLRRDREKFFTHLGIEFDCCSECQEVFTHRYHYSEPSFDEELTDNFRVFLPNNYRDIEGNTGDITNLYRLYDNLYIHTEDALWMQPKNYQERVTDEIVSFIGTGSYFEIPPKKILDGDESSAGTRHKKGAKKIKDGIVFVSEKEKKVYMFNGEKLVPITQNGMSNWFSENLELKSHRDYYTKNKKDPYYFDNPQNINGAGYLIGYDPRHERILLTKRDFQISDTILGLVDDFVAIQKGASEVLLFNDYDATVAFRKSLGYVYEGIVDNEMKFTRYITTTVNETRYDSAGNPVIVENIERLTHNTFKVQPVNTDISLWRSADLSWTMSYSLKTNFWRSYHTYLPNFYSNEGDDFFYWEHGKRTLSRQGKKGTYLIPHIVEYVSNAGPAQTKIWDYLTLNTEAKTYDAESRDFLDQRYRTFNKILLYNERQISGILDITPKDTTNLPENYLDLQVTNFAGTILLDRNERNWTLNNLRDMRVDYTKPMFNYDPVDFQDDYFIDKVVNDGVVNFSKSWMDQESFRGKYLVIRLIFDTFTDTRLITNYSRENETPSNR